MEGENRLSIIRRCGMAFVKCVDPDGVLAQFRVDSLRWEFEREDCLCRWSVFLSGDGKEVVVLGRRTESGDVVMKVRISSGGPVTEYGCNGEKCLKSALEAGGCSLGWFAAEGANNALRIESKDHCHVFPWDKVTMVCHEAMTEDTEGGRGLPVGTFGTVSFKYGGECVVLSGRTGVQNGSIESRVSVSGGSIKRKVILHRSLGLGHDVDCDCWSKANGRQIASFRVAFDVSDSLPMLYVKERRRKLKRG